ncbi:hypothetical protein G5B30_04715 [Sphingobacterium sp. SGG-5]|uniref:phosphodiester glycosidase family protein n=1 Tax=Sphingobacterium sp. SGG-5 TaxID=2710881 RepID=UPI0013ED4E14|nr:phosphodiester glycosidase family protein [Sphingobacterium sp. SGG-5]NGM61219.1 hypothetical protein [Sphingobacterium sp. SGG-5]
MRKNLDYFRVILAFVAVSLVISSCDSGSVDDSDVLPPPATVVAPAITSLSPDSGSDGTEIIITGKNFGSSKEDVKVIFGLRDAEILEWSEAELKVEAPAGFNDVALNVVVSVNGTRSNIKTFTYNDTAPPVITSLTNTCFSGSTVVIKGTDFSRNIEDNIVRFGTAEATVQEATKTSLTVIAPTLGDITSAEVTVSKYGIVSNAKTTTVDVDQNKIATFDWTTHTVKPGVIYKTAELNVFGATLRRIYILDITLNESNTLGIGFSPTEINTVTMCNTYNAFAGVNAGYFPYGSSTNKDPYIRINGTTVQSGHLDVSQLYTNSALLIHNNVATVRKFTESGRNLNLVAAAIPVNNAQNIIVCGPMLITSGVIETLDMSTSHNSSTTARTGLGVSADGKRVFMVVVDTGGGVTGVSTPQLAKILQALGAVDAMNFDGGGSSTMFVKNQGDNGRVNYPTGGTWQRPVRSVIYVK